MARIRVGKMKIFISGGSGQCIRVSECYHVFAVFFLFHYIMQTRYVQNNKNLTKI